MKIVAFRRYMHGYIVEGRHEFIHASLKCLEHYYTQCMKYFGEDTATSLICQQYDDIIKYDDPHTRHKTWELTACNDFAVQNIIQCSCKGDHIGKTSNHMTANGRGTKRH